MYTDLRWPIYGGLPNIGLACKRVKGVLDFFNNWYTFIRYTKIPDFGDQYTADPSAPSN